MRRKLILPSTVREWILKYEDDFGFVPSRADAPTDAPPGTPQKVSVFKERLEKGMHLFVLGDNNQGRREERYCDPPLRTEWRGNEMCGAEFSTCGKYRYRLWRHWAKGLPVVGFIGLNPSTADELKLDPTLRRIRNFAQSWGCGGFEMLNLFGYRSTDPKPLYEVDDPIGDGNDRAIRVTVASCSYVVVCWGIHGAIEARSAQVLWALSRDIKEDRVFCLGLTKPRPGGQDSTKLYPQPKHPLYLSGKTSAMPLPWEEMETAAAI